MGLALTAVISIIMIGVIAFLNRKNLFSESEDKGVGTVSAPTPTKETTAPATEKKEVSKEKGSSKSVWWPRLLGTGIVVLALWIGFSVYQHFSTTSSSIISRTPAGTNLSHSAPMEIAKLVICGCESNCRQFEPGTKIPLKNKERVSTAFGKYQFLESHREPAKKLGFDLDTEEGQDGYFEHLYNESKTQHWEADSRSVACWEPKLRAYTWGGGEAVSLVVKAPINEFSKPPIPLTHKGEKADLSGLGKKYTVRWNEGRSDQVDEDLPRATGVAPKNPAVAYDFRLKSREPEPVNILVKLY